MAFSLKIPRLSQIFQPLTATQKNIKPKKHDLTSKSQKLMLELGLIKQANPGSFHFLPLGVRALDKLNRIVDEEMGEIGGQKVIFPTLTNSKLWQTSNRLSTASELFRLIDRHKHDYILSPTHEEAAGDLLASLAPLSYRQFPLRLYQITSKFRDEIKPRFGLMRARQFLMKDMYSFDVDQESAHKTYRQVCNSYNKVLRRIGVDFVQVLGNNGEIGGSLSHEFHYMAEIGEDRLMHCLKCDYRANAELIKSDKCPKCGAGHIETKMGIEIGHTFLLGDRYSKPLKATCLGNGGKPVILQMGSYGLGLSRILAASLEVLSSEDELRWPLALAPFKLIVLPPKEASKEEQNAKRVLETLLKQLGGVPFVQNDFLVDDRTCLTIGRRFLDAKRMGYPFIMVLGQKIAQNPPLVELTDMKNQQHFLTEGEVINYFKLNITE